MPKPQKFVFVCTNERPQGHPKGSCIGRGSADVFQTFREVQGQKMALHFKVVATGCLEPCLAGPTVYVTPDDVWYGGVTVDDVETIIDQHLIGGTPVEMFRIDEGDFERSQRAPKPPAAF